MINALGPVGYELHSLLIDIRRRDPSELTKKTDKLGLYIQNNSWKRYTTSFTTSFITGLRSEVIEDGAPCHMHTSIMTRTYRLQHGICRIPRPASS